MKTPKSTIDSAKKQDSYTFGDKVLVGYARKKFFELFFDICHSGKIYSVQTKDFPRDTPAVIYIPESNHNIDWENPTPTESPKANKHIFVQLTPELIEYLDSRGIQAKGMNYYDPDERGRGMKLHQDHAWVISRAFEWEDAELIDDDSTTTVDPTPSDPTPSDKKNNKTKALLATAIALLTFMR